MSSDAPLVHFLQGKLADYLALLRHMVAINSFTANHRGVDEVGELTAETFAALGFTAERIQSANFQYGNHLILVRSGREEGGRPAPVIGLISHLDTVYPAAEEAANDFHWRVDGDRLYGPGTVDIKGGTVMIYMVLDALRAVYPEAFERVTWVVLLNAAEEVLTPDFGDLARERLKGAVAALVFEGGDVKDGQYQLVTARKGMARFRIEVEGRGSHAGAMHEKGANAIVQLADVIRAVADLTDYDRALTFNVGTVMGGTVMNRVPHQAAASVEMRAFDPHVFEEGVASILALNDFCSVRSASDGYPCTVHIRLEGRWRPWPDNEGTRSLFDVWAAAARELGTASVAYQSRGGLSDGNWLWDLLPTIDGLGPEGDNSHSSERSADGSKDQEYVLASSFVPKAALNVTAILRLLAR
jgi:glutamate carboxypeptidase